MSPSRPLTAPLLLTLSLALPATSQAIGVSGIDVRSYLNQPLLATINVAASPDEGIRARDLRVKIADRKMHEKYGLSYPEALKSVRFVVTPNANGGFRIRATTPYPIKEPLLNFLLELDWGNGRLYKEAALLLDPPNYQQLPKIAARPLASATPIETAANPANTQNEVLETLNEYQPAFTSPGGNPMPKSDDDIRALTPEDLVPPAKKTTPKPRRKATGASSRPVTARSPARRVASLPSKEGQYGPVRSGESLSKIARKAAGRGADKATIKALMDAIYAANPDAFAGSKDALEKGTYLWIPSETDVEMGSSYLATSAAIGISDFVTDGNDEDVVIATPTQGKKETTARAAPEKIAPTAAASSSEGNQQESPDTTQDKAGAEKEPTSVTTVAETPTGELKILPPDDTAAEISRRLSERMAQLDEAAAQTKVDEASELETVDNDPAVAETMPENLKVTAASDQISGKAADTAPSLAALVAEIESLKAERQTLLQRVTTAEIKLTETEEAVERLELKIEALNKALGQRQAGAGYSEFISAWLPWLLLPIIPLLLLVLWWRRRNDEDAGEVAPPSTPIAPVNEPDGGATPTLDADDIETVETVETSTRDLGLALGDFEPTAITQALQKQEQTASGGPDSTVSLDLTGEFPDQLQTMRAPGNALEPGSLDAVDVGPELDTGLGNLDYEKASGSDTQESIRPPRNETDFDSEVTQILTPNSDAENDEEAGMKEAQEAEVYLAYAQYSLAEESIKRLLEKEPDNDRYKLLQLKLFAGTSRMNELQALSVELLEKYPDPENGMHQQIKNICDRAFTRQMTQEKENATGEVQLSQDAKEDDAPTEAAATPLSDPTLDELMLGPDKLSATFVDDIEDYMSDETLPDLALIDIEDDNIDKTVLEDAPENTSETAPSLEFDDEDLTESELEALTVDIELDAQDDDKTEVEDHIEEFSDTDLRLEPLDLDDPKNLQDRLDINFDLESELEKYVTKVNPKDKP